MGDYCSAIALPSFFELLNGFFKLFNVGFKLDDVAFFLRDLLLLRLVLADEGFFFRILCVQSGIG